MSTSLQSRGIQATGERHTEYGALSCIRLLSIAILATSELVAPYCHGRHSEDEDSSPPPTIVILGQNPLPVTPLRQEGYFTCWSTCAEMIMNFWGKHVRQCEQASRFGYGSPSCCDSLKGLLSDIDGDNIDDCDFPYYPEFDRWGFACTNQFEQALSWEDVKREIDEGRPFAFTRMQNIPNVEISHMLVVIGYEENTRLLLCLNPAAFSPTIEVGVDYSDYNPVSNAGTSNPEYIHLSDHYGIQPKSLSETDL